MSYYENALRYRAQGIEDRSVWEGPPAGGSEG